MFYKILSVSLALFTMNAFAEEVKWTVPDGFDKASASIPKGTLTASIGYNTQYGERKVRIYTPPGYSATRAEKYPVLYLHHGIGGNENAWTSNNGQAEGYADKVMDYLYAQKDLNVIPMIVVMPMGNMTNTSGDAWQNFERVLIDSLTHYVEKNYNASSDPNMRAIAGLSMGGGQTCNFGYKNPKFFTWIGAFSPAPNTIAAATTIKDIAAVKANVHLAYFGAGTNEQDYLGRARTYHDYLNQNGVKPLYLNVVSNLGHERDNWDRQLHQFAQRIFKGITTVSQVAPFKMVPVADRSALLVRDLSPASWTMNIVRSGSELAGVQVFSLNGRTVATMQMKAPELSKVNCRK